MDRPTASVAACPLRPFCAVCFTLILTVVLAVAAGSAQADAGAVIAAKDIETKTKLIIKMRRDMSAVDAMQLVRRERTDSLVALAVGMYLETKADNAKEAAAVAAAMASRRGMFGRSATMLAINPKMASILEHYFDDGKMDTDKTRRLAAETLAAFGHIVSSPPAPPAPPKDHMDGGALPDNPEAAGDPADPADPNAPKPKPKPKGKRKGKGKNAARAKGKGVGAALQARLAKLAKTVQPKTGPMLAKLIKEKDPKTVETAVLAAALLKDESVADQIAGLKVVRNPGLEGARLLYLARTGKPLPEKTLKLLFNQRVLPPKQYIKITPYLTSYDMADAPLAYACRAIGETGKDTHLDLLHQAVEKDKDLRVRIAAAKAINRIASTKSLPTLQKAVKDCDWPVLIPVADALGMMPHTDSVQPLIDRLDKETGRFRLNCNHALCSIAGMQQGQTAKDWTAWWNEAKSTFKVDPKKTAEFRKTHRVQDVYAKQLGNFYGLSIYSDRFAYVLDTSASMKGEKIKNLMENLTLSIRGLDSVVRFNVVDFGGQIKVMFGTRGLVPAAAAKSSALHQLGYMALTLGTRSYDGMEVGMMLPEVDTIIYLSDGAPVGGQFGKWPPITHAMDILNRHRPITIHTVEFNAGAANAASMAELSGRNFGLSTTPAH